MNCRSFRPDLKKPLERLYIRYSERRFVYPDPVGFLYPYAAVEDREIVGLIAALLAYGRVAQIHGSVARVLGCLGKPAAFVRTAERRDLEARFEGFTHRFTRGDDLVGLMWGMKRLLENHGSLGACFSQGVQSGDDTVIPALTVFARRLRQAARQDLNFLLPAPDKGSACKRLHLFLRWMVRSDRVDPGGWSFLSPSMLLVPMDTHMHRISLALKLTRRRQADLRTALDVTSAFRSLSPEDPVRYDFVLTRLGMRNDGSLKAFLVDCGGRA